MAIYRKNVYCELEFLEKFKDSKLHIAAFGDDEVRKLLDNLWDFLRKSHLMLNIDNSKLLELVQKEDKSSCLSYLYKGATMCVGGCKITCTNDHKYEYAENIHKNPADRMRIDYLINRPSGVCRNWAQKYGVVILSPTCWSSEEEAETNSYLFRNCGRAVKEGEYLKWADVLQSQHNLSNCNSMVFIDNYILKSLNNLEAILNALLPRQIPGVTREDKFYLTIITAKDKSNTRNDENIYSQLVEKIKQIRPNLDFELDLFVEQNTSSNTFHDRYILTNNVIIKSGGGYDLIKNGKATKQTEVSILHPGIQSINDACDDEYMGVINRVTSKVVGCTNEGQWKHYPANEPCHNRLIVRNSE